MSPPDILLSIAWLVVALGMMLGELVRSRANERILLRRGAVEAPGDVYRPLAWAYPMMFVAMAFEGAVAGRPRAAVSVAGAVVFFAAKSLKFWAIATLGVRWTYRVLVPPDDPLVTRGPYAWMRHPNYLAVFGEIAGMAMLVGAPVTGTLSLITFAALVRKRIAVEEEALARRRI